MVKKTVRLTENDLHRIIKQCITEAMEDEPCNFNANSEEDDELTEGFGNWLRASADGLTNMKNYSQGPCKSKLVNWTNNVGRAKQNYDDMDTTQKAHKYGYEDTPEVQKAQARSSIYREPGSNAQYSDRRRSQAYQKMIDAGERQKEIDRRKKLRQYSQKN